MYDAQKTKDRIKQLCKLRKISVETLLSECGLGVNAIRQINDKKGMASYSLAKIADYLGCSIDYLLGRSDHPDRQAAPLTDDDLKFALFGGENGISDAQLDEVKKFAAFIKERDREKK